MPATATSAAPSDPSRILTEAVNAARAAGHRVTTDLYPGVVLASTLVPTWERDPRSTTMSPLGAVLWHRQPAVADLDAAIAAALGVGVAYHLGFEAGLRGDKALEDRLTRPHMQRLAGQGFVAGVEMRALLHRRDAVALKSAPALATTAPRKLLRELLDSLTLSQALEMLANLERDRAATLGGAAGEAHTVAEAELRGLARDAAGDGL